MPHILEQYTENLGNVVENEQQIPLSERNPKEVVFMNVFTGGEQTSQSGMTHQFKESDLDQVVESYNPEVHLAPLIRGHDEKDDGAPSSGWVKKLVRKGLELFAYVALTGFGQQILEEGNYKKVSCRFYPPDDPANPTPGKLSLRHLALVTIPAVKGLQEFSEARDKNYDWDFSVNLEYYYAEPHQEKQEVKESIIQAMNRLNLDGEDEEMDSDPDVQKMELNEEEDEKKKHGDPVEFNPKLVGMTKANKFILDGDDTILEDAKFSETPVSEIAKKDNDEETVHDSDTKRQKEYREIIKDSTPVEYTEEKELDPMEKINQLVDALLQHFSPSSPKDPTPQLILGADGENDKPKMDCDDKSGFMPLDGVVEIEITKVDDLDEDMEHGEKESRCWEGYEPVPGKKPYEDGSCQKKSDHSEESDMKMGENIEEPIEYPTTEELQERKEEAEGLKKVELIVPEKRKSSVKRLANQSFSESITADLSEVEQMKQKIAWNDFAEAYYSQGVLTESIIPKEELIDSLMFLDNQTSNLSFSEGQVNPLDTIKKILDRMPPVVGLNGFEQTPKSNAENLFKDGMIEPDSNSLVYSENNVAFDSGSLNIHQQALDYSEKNGVDYYSAIQKIIAG